jgi:fumarate hydratase class II
VFQTGSGTSTNMNMNEVLATLATERLRGQPAAKRAGGGGVHPNDEVNASQSSNDMFPSAIHVAAARALRGDLVPALERLALVLRKKQRAFANGVKSGRTHLMDATPVTLGQEFGGYATAVEHGVERIHDVLPRVGELPLGGTASEPASNAPKRFAKGVIMVPPEVSGLSASPGRVPPRAEA